MTTGFLNGLSILIEQRSTITVAGGLAFLILMGLSAFFSSSEIAMFSLAKHRIDALVEEGAEEAERVQALRENPHRMLVTILVGNNLANIAMSSIATGLLAMYFPPSESVLIATFGVTSLVLLFSESAPKSYAVANPESWALRIARPIQATQTVLYPVVVVFDHLTRLVNRATGGQPTIESAYITRTELLELVEAGERQGVLEETEGEIIEQTLKFTSTIANEVMVPRADIEAVRTTESVDEALERCVSTGHRRLPVYDGDFETVLGIVTLNDLVEERHFGAHDTDLTGLVRPTEIVPETKPIGDLLAEMQRDRIEMVMVIDEFGSIGGLITIEDILEELVGEILRPAEELPIEIVDETTALVLGDVAIEAVNDALGTEFPTENAYETIAGLLLEQAGQLLAEGETVSAFGVKMTPIRVESGRILKVRIQSPSQDHS